MSTPELEKRARAYFANRGYSAHSRLGAGTQGTVYVADIPSLTPGPYEQVAVKFHHREIAYRRELGV